MDLVEHCYRFTRNWPPEERFGLVGQVRRAAVSIPANIAEGSCRKSDRVFRNHLAIALGSHAELETYLELAKRLGYVTAAQYLSVADLCARTGQLTNGLYRSFRDA